MIVEADLETNLEPPRMVQNISYAQVLQTAPAKFDHAQLLGLSFPFFFLDVCFGINVEQ